MSFVAGSFKFASLLILKNCFITHFFLFLFLVPRIIVNSMFFQNTLDDACLVQDCVLFRKISLLSFEAPPPKIY